MLQDRLSQALTLCGRQRRRVAVMMLDVDHFKNVNDTLGHTPAARRPRPGERYACPGRW
jgi:diguanylate cyclase (GGDEF)-like protein